MKQLDYLLILPLFLFLTIHGISQEECGTEYSNDPNFDLEKYERFVSEMKLRSPVLKIVPIVPHIVRHTTGAAGLNPDKIFEILDTVNQRFAPLDVQFEICTEIDFINNSALFHYDRARYPDSLEFYNIPNVVNIYFIDRVLNDESVFCGYANFPWSSGQVVVVQNSCAVNGSTLAHELGHYFGLLHTHETSRGIEFVDGRDCDVAGDELCDTPADPRLGGSNVNFDCEYVGNHKDLDGKRYRPDPRNIMSYSRKECRDYFSPQQLERMRYYLETSRNELACLTTSQIIPGPRTSMTWFPNPSNGRIHYKIQGSHIYAFKIEIRDMLGRIHWSKKLAGSEAEGKVDQTLSPGIYSAVILGDGLLHSSKIVVH